MKRGKKNGGKIHKNGEKGLKNVSFWVINSNNSLGKENYLKRGGGGVGR